jgi:O-antigen/teichoic acid export membrane protein
VNLIDIIAFALRSGSALAKLVFVTYLGLLSYDSLLGQFAVFSTIAIVFTQIAGLEINQTIGRKLHSLSKNEQVRLYHYQVIAALISYLLLSGPIIILYNGLLEVYWIVGVLILCLEHYTTELYRFYILTLNPLKASLLLFTKNSGWVLLFIVLHQYGYIAAKMSSILFLWLLCLLIAATIGSPKCKAIYSIYQNFDSKNWRKQTFHLVWSSKLFMLSAIAIAGIGAVDKLLIGSYFTLEQLGDYYFYQTIASIPALVVSFSIGATLWPKCIKLAATGDWLQYIELWRSLKTNYTFIIVTLSLAIAFAIPIVLKSLNRPVSSLELLYTLIASSSALAICDPYKLDLYVRKRDKALLMGNATQLLLVLTLVVIGVTTNKIEFAAIGLFVANLVSLFLYHNNVPIKIVQFIARR